MSSQKDVYTTSREEAAVILGVSTRTIDRYLKGGRLKYKTDGRTILVNAEELTGLAAKFAAKKKIKQTRQAQARTQAARSAPTATVTMESNHDEKIFRELYTDTLTELKAKQEKLEAASFRVGQLESQLKNSVPLLEYKQKEETLTQENNWLKDRLSAMKTRTWLLLIGFILAAAAAVALGLLSLNV